MENVSFYVRKMKNGEMDNVSAELDFILLMEDVMYVRKMRITLRVKKDAKENVK